MSLNCIKVSKPCLPSGIMIHDISLSYSQLPRLGIWHQFAERWCQIDHKILVNSFVRCSWPWVLLHSRPYFWWEKAHRMMTDQLLWKHQLSITLQWKRIYNRPRLCFPNWIKWSCSSHFYCSFIRRFPENIYPLLRENIASLERRSHHEYQQIVWSIMKILWGLPQAHELCAKPFKSSASPDEVIQNAYL